jgi:formate dehydrogenase subunit gamma
MVMDRNKWLIITTLIVITGLGIFLFSLLDILLLDSAPWLLIVSMVIGITFGALRSRVKNKPSIHNEQIARHGLGAFLEHWGTALGIFILIITGFIIGFLFFPHFADTPKSIIFPLNMHFLGILITFLGGFFFLTDYVLSRNFRLLIPNIKDIINGTIVKYLLRKKWGNESKYLSSQKSAFLVFAVLGGIQLVTGSIKITAHFLSIPAVTLAVITLIHDIFSLLFIIMLIVHILMAITLPSHRTLLKSWFTGKISEQYIKENHNAWYEELKETTGSDNCKKYMEEKD